MSNVPKKNSDKVGKNDILEKKIPMWRSTDRQALFFGLISLLDYGRRDQAKFGNILKNLDPQNRSK